MKILLNILGECFFVSTSRRKSSKIKMKKITIIKLRLLNSLKKKNEKKMLQYIIGKGGRMRDEGVERLTQLDITQLCEMFPEHSQSYSNLCAFIACIYLF